jgi:O-antigen ligase
VASKTKKKKSESGSARQGIAKQIWLLAIGFLLVEIAVLPGAASPFRTPKSVLALIIILVVVGLSVVGQLRRGRLELRWSPLATLLVALPLLQVVSISWSGSRGLALQAACESAIWIAAALWIATISPSERLKLIDGAALGAAVSGIVLMIQASGQAILSLGPAGPSGRLSLTGLTGNPADLAMAAVLLLPLVLAATGASDRPRYRWVLAVLLSAAAVISQTLTAFLALFLVWGTWLILQRSRRLWIGASITAVVLIAAGLATGLDTRIKHQISRIEKGDWYFLLSARSDGWTAAGEMVRNDPLTGAGASNFTYAYYPSRIAWLDRSDSLGQRAELATHFRFAHCDPLQMVAELGVPGFLWILAFSVVAVVWRPRGDPLATLFAVAFIPFLLLHFPTHLAVGLVPLILAIGHVLAGGREVTFEPGPWFKRVAIVGVLLVVATGCYWQLHRLMLNLWRGGLSYALTTAQMLDDDQRAQQAAAVEAQILPRIPALSQARPWLWRMVGQARFARGDDMGAEAAFRNAMTLWPHEEAEFGLGLALADQDRRLQAQGPVLDSRNRRGEAIVHLARVCRTNPALLELIAEEELRQAVAEIIGVADGRRQRQSR